jgi:putative ABC transport system substrate-binding protein
MQRREFINLLGASVAASPLAAEAQQAKVLTIGYLGPTTPAVESQRLSAFVRRLRELNWIEGRNLAIEYRWAEGRPERFSEIASELVRLKVDVIVTFGVPPTIAAKQATSDIPIVIAATGDPVGSGLVASLARPGGNVTGLSSQQTDTATKRLELIREIVPHMARLAVLFNADNSAALRLMPEIEAAARAAFAIDVTTYGIRRAEDIVPTLQGLTGRADALFIVSDPLVDTNRVRINTLAVAARLPTIHASREYVEAGGLMSYGPNIPDLYRRAADYVDKILRGTKPADMPVEQPTRFDLVVNLTTAKAIGLTIPESFLVRATEVIE